MNSLDKDTLLILLNGIKDTAIGVQETLDRGDIDLIIREIDLTIDYIERVIYV